MKESSIEYASDRILRASRELREEISNAKHGTRLRSILEELNEDITGIHKVLVSSRPTVVMKPPLWRLPTLRIKGAPPPIEKEKTWRR